MVAVSGAMILRAFTALPIRQHRRIFESDRATSVYADLGEVQVELPVATLAL